MKKTLFLSLALICSLTAFTQNTTWRYDFDYGYNEIYWYGPVLSHGSCTGLAWVTLPVSLTKNVARFSKGCGLVFSDSVKNFIASGNYTIELYFKLDSVQGYKKLIDFAHRSKDAGLYNQSGKIVLYPSSAAGDSFMAGGTYQYVAITRNDTTKNMYINGNGKTLGTQTDNTNTYVLDSAKILTFFQDDSSTNGEQSGGEVAMIHISNYAMDSNAIKAKYTNLHGVLNVPDNQIQGAISIYPNPVTDFVNVTVPANCNYMLTDITGRNVREHSLKAGINRIRFDDLQPGVYFLNLSDQDGRKSGAYKIIKE
jgi:OOP family OmpA-OmpF porin